MEPEYARVGLKLNDPLVPTIAAYFERHEREEYTQLAIN